MAKLNYARNTTIHALIAELPRIVQDEGLILEIYLCPKDHPTFGLGTLITPDMPEYGLPVGTPVSEYRCLEAFFEDCLTVLTDGPRSFPKQWDIFPQEARRVFLNVIYNMGLTRFRRFVKCRQAARELDWKTAAAELVDSKYGRDVTKVRAARLAARLAKLAKPAPKRRR